MRQIIQGTWRVCENELEHEGLHVLCESKDAGDGIIICEQISDIGSARLIAAAPELYAMLGNLAAQARTLNNLQHAGIKIDPMRWSDLYQDCNKAEALIYKISNSSRELEA